MFMPWILPSQTLEKDDAARIVERRSETLEPLPTEDQEKILAMLQETVNQTPGLL